MAINIADLKVNNWVTLKGGAGSPFQITPKSFSRFLINEVTDYDPIPLTPEVLEAAGFEKRIDGIYKKDLFTICHFEDNKWFWCDPHGVEMYSPMPLIKHLHHLQNLYLDLTGTELKVNLHQS